MNHHPEASADEEPQDGRNVRRSVLRELSRIALALLTVTSVLWWVIATGNYAPAPLLLPVWGAAGLVVDRLPTWRVLYRRVRGQTRHANADAGDQTAARPGAAQDPDALRRGVRANLLLMVTLLIIGCLQLWYELVHDGHVGLGGVVVVLLGAAITLHLIRESRWF